jgi:hypothetical protein
MDLLPRGRGGRPFYDFDTYWRILEDSGFGDVAEMMRDARTMLFGDAALVW